MANIKIAQLTNATTISDSDILLIEDAVATKKITMENFKKEFISKKGGSAWVSAETTFDFGALTSGTYLLGTSRGGAGGSLWAILVGANQVFQVYGYGQFGTPSFDVGILKFLAHGGGGESVYLYAIA